MKSVDLLKWIGKRVVVDFKGLRIECDIVESKVAYGSLKLQVLPVHGSGSTWIEESRIVQVIPEEKG